MPDNLLISTIQITSLVKSLTKKNYKASVTEIHQLVDSIKPDGEYHLFRILFSLIDFTCADCKSSKDLLKCQLLAAEINSKISQPNFCSLICQAIDYPLANYKSFATQNHFLSNVSKCLKFSKLYEVVFGICLLKSTQSEIRNIAIQWIKQKLPDLLRTYVDGDSSSKEKSGFQEISSEILHLLLNFLASDKDNSVIGQDQLNAFLETLRKDLPVENFPVVLSGFLYGDCDPTFDKCTKETSMVKVNDNILANYLEELGPLVSQNADDLKYALNDMDSKLINPASIAKCICMFIKTLGSVIPIQILPMKQTGSGFDKLVIKEKELTNWNLENFFNVIFDKNKEIDKRQIIKELDCKEFNLSSKVALEILISCISKCVTPFPVSIFYNQWKYSEAQFSFLKMVYLNTDVVFLMDFPYTYSDMPQIKLDDRKHDPILYWTNIEYVNAILNISEVGLYHECLELCEKALTSVPYILYFALIKSTVKCQLRSNLLQIIYKRFLNTPNVPIQYFKPNREEFVMLLLNAMIDNYKENERTLKDVRSVIRSADVLLELKDFHVIWPIPGDSNHTCNLFRMNQKHFRYEIIHLALDAVIYWSKKKFENSKNFFSELLTKDTNKHQNYKAVIAYLQVRYPRLMRENRDTTLIVPQEIILDNQYCYELLKFLDNIGRNSPDFIQSTEWQCVSIMLSRLSNQISSNTNVIGRPLNTIGQQPIAQHPLHSFTLRSQSVQQVQPQQAILGLSNTKNKLDPTKSAFIPQSKMPRQQDVIVQQTPEQKAYAESFPSIGSNNYSKNYYHPEDATQMIEKESELDIKKLYEGELSLEKIAEKYCTPNPNNREYINALVRLSMDELSFLEQYPEKQAKIFSDLLIQLLMTNNLLTQEESSRIYDKMYRILHETCQLSTKELINRVIGTANSRNMRVAPSEYSIPSGSQQNMPSVSTIMPPTGHRIIENPPDNITEKVYFVINNVSKSNVNEKSNELANIITREHMNWFAQYIVMKRVTTESNFHELFIKVIENMSLVLTGLKEQILSETYRNIKYLLLNMKNDLSDYNDRQILKNLGKFLGMVTLSKNKPILHDDLNLKDLLHEAYSKGQTELQYVVPFVTKTVDTAKDSIVFKPPCPWTMGILKVLKELHEMESVKLNLKFEVEILCRNLKIDFKTIHSGNYLRDRSLQVEAQLCGIFQSNSGATGTNLSQSGAPTSVMSANHELDNAAALMTPGGHSGVLLQGTNNRPNRNIPSNALQQALQHGMTQFGTTAQSQQQQQQQIAQVGRSGNLQSQQLMPTDASQQQPLRIYSSQPTPQQQAQRMAEVAVRQYPANLRPPELTQYMNQLNIASQSQPAGPVQPPPQSHQQALSLQQAITHGNMPMVNTGLEGPTKVAVPIYEDLNIHSIANYLSLDEMPATLLTQIPDLRTQVLSQIEKVLTELVTPLYDRCAKTTIGTVEQLIHKDFGLDTDFMVLKTNAINMCRYLTCGLCLVTSRDIVTVQLLTAIKQIIFKEYRIVTTQDREQVENFANKVVGANLEMCIAILQKIIAEKTLIELDKKLTTMETLHQQNITANGNALVRRKIPPNELHVYDIFCKMIPGFPVHQSYVSQQQQSAPQDFNMSSYSSIQPHTNAFVNNNRCEDINLMFRDVERHIQSIDSMCHNEMIFRKLRELLDTANLAFRKNEALLMHDLTKQVILSLMELYHSKILIEIGQPNCVEIIERIKEAHFSIIRELQPVDESSGFTSGIVSIWIGMPEPQQSCNIGPGKYNAEAFAELLKTHVVALLPVNLFLSKQIIELNLSAIAFTLELLKYFVTGAKREFTVLNEFDLSASIDSLNQLMNSQNNSQLPSDLYDSLRVNLSKLNQLYELGNLEKLPLCNYLYNGISLSREFDETTAMTSNTQSMVRKWFDNYDSTNQRNPQYISNIILHMDSVKVIHDDEHFVRFLRLSTVLVIESAYNSLKQDSKYVSQKTLMYIEIDAYAMLLCQLINKTPFTKNELSGKVALLSKSLGIIAGTLLQEHEVRRNCFHPMPFQRLFVMLFNELQATIEEENQHEFQQHVLAAFVHTYHVIRPKCAPPFVFSWLELISHRNFVAKILKPSNGVNTDYTHGLYVQLLCDLFQFLGPYLENLHLIRPIQCIYKGTANIICLLMHDFPEVLINYHSLLCTKLPMTCIQLRNIILCTTMKRMMPLPDVVSSNSTIDQLNQMEDPTGYCMNAGERIKPYKLFCELNHYLDSRAPVKFLSELVNGLKKENDSNCQNLLLLSSNDVAQEVKLPEELLNRRCYRFKSNGVIHYDVELMNNVLIYLCITAVKVLRERNIPLNIHTIAHTPQMDIMQSLVLNLDNEGRFLLLNCMVNQLRYPNSHTYYFIFTILYLFMEQPQESVKEQITRVILERIIINRPHPWGLLFVMNELFKNSVYKFWDRRFLHCSEEIENILDSVGQGFGSPMPNSSRDGTQPIPTES